MSWLEVTGGQTIGGVRIVLGPKAGRLVWWVLESETHQPVLGPRMVLYPVGRPRDYIAPGLGPGFDYVLVPSAKPVMLRVSAHGYQTWYYGSDGTLAHAMPLRISE
jgi:hypothetical protein